MSLKDELKLVSDQFHHLKSTLDLNHDLLEIHEGALLKFVERELEKELSARAFTDAKPRIPPINLERRVVDKLSTLYAKPPQRSLGDKSTDSDKKMWEWYAGQMSIDVSGQNLNEYFNLHKGSAWEPYLDNRFNPRLREIPKDRFFVMGLDPTNRLRVTHFVKVMGYSTLTKDGKDCQKCILYVYTDNEFTIIDEDGDKVADLISKLSGAAAEGKNEFGVIPFVYVNRSKTNINPSPDDDMYRMATLIPILLSDLNYAVKYQCFSMLWGVDVDLANLKFSPNAFINLKTDPNNPDLKPQLNLLKPEVDIAQVMSLVMDELALWLQSKNIRPGSVGSANKDSFQNGISKMIDEMDTTSDRKKQIPIFKDAEEELFYLVAYKLHPVWSRQPSFLEKVQFSAGISYSVKFAEQISWQTRLETVQECKEEIDIGILSRETAMKRVNPDMTEEQIQEEMDRIKGEQDIFAPKDTQPFKNQGFQGGNNGQQA